MGCGLEEKGEHCGARLYVLYNVLMLVSIMMFYVSKGLCNELITFLKICIEFFN